MGTKSKQARLDSIVQKLDEVKCDLEDLTNEVADAVTAVEGTNLEHTERNQARAEAAQTLQEQIDALETAVDELGGLEL